MSFGWKVSIAWDHAKVVCSIDSVTTGFVQLFDTKQDALNDASRIICYMNWIINQIPLFNEITRRTKVETIEVVEHDR